MKPYFNLIGNSQCQNSKATLIKENDNKCCSYTEVCPLFLAGELQIPLPTGKMIEKVAHFQVNVQLNTTNEPNFKMLTNSKIYIRAFCK